MQQRIRQHPVLSVFDGADTNASTPQREESTAPVASLFLMNAPLAHGAASNFAARLLTDRSSFPEQIDHAHRIAFGRPARQEEFNLAAEFIEQSRAALSATIPDSLEAEAAALASYTRVLFCSNEFVYID